MQEYIDKGFQLIELGNDKKPKKRRKLKKGGCSKHSVTPSDDMKIAIVPPDNIMIIDVDVKGDKVGLESLERLQDDLFMEFEPNVISGSGGIHIYVGIDRPYKIEQKDYPDIDFICYKPDKNTCTPYAVAGGQTITFEGKDYVYELLSTEIQVAEGLHEILEENVYEVQLDDTMIDVSDLHAKKSGEEVESLLKWIDADDYHEWVANCAAIKNELGNIESAFEIFHNWSKTADSYSSREDCLTKWKSIDSNHGNPRTMGTIYMNSLQNKLDQLIIELSKLDPDDTHELYKFLKEDRWQGYPWLNDNVVYNDIAKALSNRYELNMNESKNLLKKTGISRLKDISNVNETAMVEIIEDGNPFSNYVKSLAFTRNNIYNLLTGERLGDTELSDRHHRDLIKIQNRLGLKKAFTVRHVFQKQMIPVVSFNEYNPTTNDRIFMNNRGAKVLNLFDPSTVPDPSRETEEGTKLIRKFIRHLEILTSKKEASTLLDWMAYCSQNPGKKVLWVPMIQSVEGAGKSVIGNLLINHVFGKSNAGIVDSVIIADKNNSWASSKMMRILEEIKLTGHNRYEVLNQLKPLITNPTITRVEKFEVSSEVRNTCNFLAFTNYKDALPVDETDRRWWIVFSSIDDLKDLERKVGKNLHEYFSPLHQLAKETSPYGGEFKTFLLNRDLSSFNPNFPPESKHKEELAEIERSKIDGMEELYHILLHLYSEDYPGSEYPKLIDVREIKLASEIATDDNGQRISKDMKIKDIKYILKKMKYIQLKKEDAFEPDWSGISPILYHKPTTTLSRAIELLKNKTNKDVISKQFEDLDDL